MNRRHLLKLAMLAASGAAPFGRAAWAVAGGSGERRLVVVFLRGAVDGLSVVVPHGDADYYAARPSIAIPRGAGGVLDLDGYFGLHPALGAMLPLWREKSLAFIHAAGSPDPTRSHFDAQLYMETGTPGRPGTPDGWMNRLLAALPGPHPPTQGVAFGPTVPRIMSGKVPVANIGLGRDAGRPMPLDRPAVADAFDRLYSGNDTLSLSYRQGRRARQELLSDMEREQMAADNGAPAPDGFLAAAARLARLVAKDPGIRLAFLALGGWDTHVNQGSGEGQLANHLRPLGDGLAALAKGLGPAYGGTVILVVSEFGRTARENGDSGTDHGHGNVIWVLGGSVAGGRVYGEWPGLAQSRLHDGRDLAVTTDFRTAIGTIVERHLRLGDRALATVFPEMPKPRASLGGIIRA